MLIFLWTPDLRYQRAVDVLKKIIGEKTDYQEERSQVASVSLPCIQGLSDHWFGPICCGGGWGRRQGGK